MAKDQNKPIDQHSAAELMELITRLREEHRQYVEKSDRIIAELSHRLGREAVAEKRHIVEPPNPTYLQI